MSVPQQPFCLQPDPDAEAGEEAAGTEEEPEELQSQVRL